MYYITGKFRYGWNGRWRHIREESRCFQQTVEKGAKARACSNTMFPFLQHMAGKNILNFKVFYSILFRVCIRLSKPKFNNIDSTVVLAN